MCFKFHGKMVGGAIAIVYAKFSDLFCSDCLLMTGGSLSPCWFQTHFHDLVAFMTECWSWCRLGENIIGVGARPTLHFDSSHQYFGFRRFTSSSSFCESGVSQHIAKWCTCTRWLSVWEASFLSEPICLLWWWTSCRPTRDPKWTLMATQWVLLALSFKPFL